MHILVLSKRQYTGKDLIDDQYGRVFEIPAQLSGLGHEVRGFSLSYRKRSQGDYAFPLLPRVNWHSMNAIPNGLMFYNRNLNRYLDSWKPDCVWATSDSLHIALAQRWCKQSNIPLVVDLYDNYESFGLSKIPFLVSALRNACKSAALVTTASESLTHLVRSKYGRKGKTVLVPNAARKDLFYQRNKNECRLALDLPEQALLIGTAGAIHENRGISDLLNAFQLLKKKYPDLWLVLAGPRDRSLESFKDTQIIDMGVLPLDKVPVMLSSLDVAIVCNRNSNFGQYCSPLKLIEILASKVPFVAAAVGDIPHLFASRKDCLYSPGNAQQLANRIEKHLQGFNFSDLPTALDWRQSALILNAAMKEI